MHQDKPQVSIILEWENALLSEMDRAREMLRQVRQQVMQQNLDFEMVVLFNPEQIDRSLLENELKTGLDDEARLPYRIEPAQGLHYYDLKNYGAKIAAADIIVFVDSDVIPEEGWLSSLLQPLLEDPSLNVVAGTSYIDPVDFTGKAFALSWLFPLRSKHSYTDRKAKSFHANNLALRKDYFLNNPFPEMPHGMTRGACGMLAARMRSQGQVICRQHAAKVSHPPPNGLSHTLVRAIAEGRDGAFKERTSGNRVAWFFKVVRKFVRKIFNRAVFRVIRDRGEVGLPLWQVPFAVLLMLGYYLLALVGGIMTVIMPGYMSRGFRI
jgi:hypothetical protein